MKLPAKGFGIASSLSLLANRGRDSGIASSLPLLANRVEELGEYGTVKYPMFIEVML